MRHSQIVSKELAKEELRKYLCGQIHTFLLSLNVLPGKEKSPTSTWDVRPGPLTPPDVPLAPWAGQKKRLTWWDR